MRPIPPSSMTQSLASPLRCAGCGKDDDLARGWRIYLAPWQPRAAWTVCPECAERELGEDER
jgi:hypothetical protein